ncbi:MAG TPA: hypothetical protein PKD72_09235, partial [Gemmatales bacterium]|nr:hypothetical protein [Gemmatales bacterium]
KLYFAFACLLALAWSGWLIHLVRTAADPIIVSAPQIHLASLVVVGRVSNSQPLAKVTIEKIYKNSLLQQNHKPVPKEVELKNWQYSDEKSAGLLLLPLAKLPGEDNLFEIAPIPVPNGYYPPRFYPLTESTFLQVQRILGQPLDFPQ